MYLPPAAAWEVGTVQWQRRLLLGLGGLGLLAGLGFCLNQRWGFSTVLVLLLQLACLAMAAMGMRRAVRGTLRWDGERWYWFDAHEHAVLRIVCVIDWQRCLLLHIACEPGSGHWLWLEHSLGHSQATSGSGERWLALRRAVVASRRAPLAPGAHSLPQ